MPALKKNPKEVKMQRIAIRLTEQEYATVKKWTKKAKRGHRLNDCANISELVRKLLLPLLERDIEAKMKK